MFHSGFSPWRSQFLLILFLLLLLLFLLLLLCLAWIGSIAAILEQHHASSLFSLWWWWWWRWWWRWLLFFSLVVFLFISFIIKSDQVIDYNRAEVIPQHRGRGSVSTTLMAGTRLLQRGLRSRCPSTPGHPQDGPPVNMNVLVCGLHRGQVVSMLSSVCHLKKNRRYIVICWPVSPLSQRTTGAHQLPLTHHTAITPTSHSVDEH